MTFDRDAILARTDLAQLADELLGGHKGSGTGARWPSPVPGHPQTGKTPPMTIFRARNGDERWTCWATGASGTAIDLLVTVHGMTVREALERLAARAGSRSGDVVERAALRSGPRRDAGGPPCERALSAMEHYLTACEANLWSTNGTAVRRWLTESRRLDPSVLRANRVGADPGERALPREIGLPTGFGAVFPVLEDRQPVYLQLRRLAKDGPKYVSPYARQFGPNPRLASIVAPPGSPGRGPVVVTEGICDGLTVAAAGFEAVALLGAAMPNEVIAGRLAARGRALVLALDGDVAGRASTERLHTLLVNAGRRDVVSLPIPDNLDLNDWARELGPGFRRVLGASIGAITAARSVATGMMR